MEITAETLGTVETNSSTGTQTTGKYSNFALFNFENKKKPFDIKIKNFNPKEPKIKQNIKYSAKQNFRRYKSIKEPILRNKITVDDNEDLTRRIQKMFLEDEKKNANLTNVITAPLPYNQGYEYIPQTVSEYIQSGRPLPDSYFASRRDGGDAGDGGDGGDGGDFEEVAEEVVEPKEGDPKEGEPKEGEAKKFKTPQRQKRFFEVMTEIRGENDMIRNGGYGRYNVYFRRDIDKILEGVEDEDIKEQIKEKYSDARAIFDEFYSKTISEINKFLIDLLDEETFYKIDYYKREIHNKYFLVIDKKYDEVKEDLDNEIKELMKLVDISGTSKETAEEITGETISTGLELLKDYEDEDEDPISPVSRGASDLSGKTTMAKSGSAVVALERDEDIRRKPGRPKDVDKALEEEEKERMKDLEKRKKKAEKEAKEAKEATKKK